MKKCILTILLLSSVHFPAYAALVTWTADIKSITVFPSGKAQIVLTTPTNPNPAGNSWSCPNSIVLLGNPANKSLLSLALTNYVSQRPVRIGVDPTSLNAICQANNLSGI